MKIDFTRKEFFWKYYDSCLQNFNDYKSCGWIDSQSQTLRYSAMFETGIIQSNSTILDWGCGDGNLIEFLQNINFNFKNYTGYDINPKMIDFALNKFPDNNFTSKLSRSKTDWVVASGIFSIDISEDEMKSEIQSMWKHSKIGVAFNLISDGWSGAGRNLCTWNKSQVLEWVSSNFPKIKVVQGYLGDEDFTVFLLRQ